MSADLITGADEDNEGESETRTTGWMWPLEATQMGAEFANLQASLHHLPVSFENKPPNQSCLTTVLCSGDRGKCLQTTTCRTTACFANATISIHLNIVYST